MISRNISGKFMTMSHNCLILVSVYYCVDDFTFTGVLLVTFVAFCRFNAFFAVPVQCTLDGFIGTDASFAGFSGDGGDATSSQIDQPFATYIDTVDKLYIADFGNNRVRMVNSQKIITTVAGTFFFVFEISGFLDFSNCCINFLFLSHSLR